jgi:hypothetical protein
VFRICIMDQKTLNSGTHHVDLTEGAMIDFLDMFCRTVSRKRPSKLVTWACKDDRRLANLVGVIGRIWGIIDVLSIP